MLSQTTPRLSLWNFENVPIAEKPFKLLNLAARFAKRDFPNYNRQL